MINIIETMHSLYTVHIYTVGGDANVMVKDNLLIKKKVILGEYTNPTLKGWDIPLYSRQLSVKKGHCNKNEKKSLFGDIYF